MNWSIFADILSQPTAPFREGHVAFKSMQNLEMESVPHFQDPIGNVVVGVASEKEYLERITEPSKEPLIVFMAHMDHPGFHGVSWASRYRLKVKWFGGSPTRFLRGAKVWVANDSGFLYEGVLKKSQLLASHGALDTAEIVFEKDTLEEVAIPAEHLFGGFAFGFPIGKKGKIFYAHAADDLVGVSVIVSLACELGAKSNFVGLLTRAEEVGFIGAIHHFDLGWLAQAERPVVVVSLETSRALPNAEIGKGPVVRLGDKATTFHPGALQVLSRVAQNVLPKKHQRRLMDGGTCEATVANAFGFQAIGISVPLGNYHNQSIEGGPRSRGPQGPAPEFVHQSDVAGMYQLCKGLVQPGLPWGDPWGARVKEFQEKKKAATELLAEGAYYPQPIFF